MIASHSAAESVRIAANADPIWLHQNEMWELMVPDEASLPPPLEF
jgi:hypothetical protein